MVMSGRGNIDGTLVWSFLNTSEFSNAHTAALTARISRYVREKHSLFTVRVPIGRVSKRLS